MTDTTDMRTEFGALLRSWRERRRLSQLALALEGGISSRHLSYIETGRASPSREMVLRLAEQLDIPLRERNRLLLSAGFAPAFAERGLDDPTLAQMRAMVTRILEAHAPFPAVAIDRHWHLVAANAAVPPLLAGAAEALLKPPVNVLRLTLHPEGLAPRIVNLGEWRGHLLARLSRQIADTGDAALAALRAEVASYPSPPEEEGHAQGLAVPFRIRTASGVLSFLSTSMVFGTPREVTLSELAIEAFLPEDAATLAALTG
ncbi:helix-turn-helix domain-containing protein [Elioraea rosea]|uniref:helix-turn-helix domain-containing protein n=1 Tax=Elioraea rosea TaxID=2492390 RepID=UPI00118237A7|nr:helix-turn-helix transcriptional regulator [Elioraea rosea]